MYDRWSGEGGMGSNTLSLSLSCSWVCFLLPDDQEVGRKVGLPGKGEVDSGRFLIC